LLTTRNNTHSFDELSLSYNGGKDCLVLLVLLLACLAHHLPTTTPQQQHHHHHNQTPNGTAPTKANGDASLARDPPRKIQSVYIVSPDPFPEVDAFVAASAAAYHLDLDRFAAPMRGALEAHLRRRPAVRAVFVGTRRTDPHGAALTHFAPTDAGWPAFVRVHPVIDWHYADVWTVSCWRGGRGRGLSDGGWECGKMRAGADAVGGLVSTRARDPLLLPLRPGEPLSSSQSGVEFFADRLRKIGIYIARRDNRYTPQPTAQSR
jgi:hypothetical protein